MTQAGGALDPGLVRDFHGWLAERGGRFFVMYGQTEAAPRVAVLPSADLPEKCGSVGLAMLSGRITIVATSDESGLSDGREAGEVCYSGPNVMMGYAHARADLARGDEMSGTFATGDLGYLDADGFLYLCGRKSRTVSFHGTHINLDQIEALLNTFLPTAAAIIKNDLLYIYAEGQPHAQDWRIHQAISTHFNIPGRKIEISRVEALPLTPNGKIDYRRLE
jgi:acyl-CoA synthetase (AMP-forming)/AMP-acid ligase II